MWKIIILLNFSFYCSHCLEIIPVDSARKANIPMAILWNDCWKSIFYVDFRPNEQQPTIFRYDDGEDQTYGASVEGYSSATFISPVGDCREGNYLFAVGLEHYTVIVEWDGKSSVAKPIKRVFGVQENDPTSVMGIARPSEDGRFYSGTYHDSFCGGPANASFYVESDTKELEFLFTGARSTTGIAFDKNLGMVYRTDSCSPKIMGYKTDSSGKIYDEIVAWDLNNTDFHPIGLETSADGKLYTTSYTSGKVVEFDRRTSTARQIAQMPGNGTGGLAFGGRNRSTLFVTVGKTVIDPVKGNVIQLNNVSTLFKIDGLHRKGREFKPLML